MAEKKPEFLKSALYWGAILGVALIIYNLLLYFVDLSLKPWASWISYPIYIGAIILATKKYRDTEMGGVITYGQALGFGTMVVAVSSVLIGIYMFVFMKYIDPTFVEKMLQLAEEKMIEQGIPESQIEMGIEMQRKFMQPWIVALITVPSGAFLGFLISLFTSIFLKKKAAEIPFEN